MKPLVLLASFSLPLLIGCSLPKYQPTEGSYRQAFVTGEIQEALTSYEAQAREAEKNAQASLFPQQYLEAAADAYRLAGRAAREAGQLQKAITYGEKALKMAEKSKNPGVMLPAINQLSYTYSQLRNFAKSRELIEEGIAIVKELPPNTDVPVYLKGLLYEQLGNELIREREYEKAINLFSLAVYYEQQSYEASVRRNPVGLNVARGNVVSAITGLGNAYRRAGRLKESVAQYELALDYIKEWGLKYPEADVYGNMGDVYFEQKNFPQALESFQKVLALGESRQIPRDITWATRRIGDILRETGKPAEAVPYYERAIAQIESTRGLLESGNRILRVGWAFTPA